MIGMIANNIQRRSGTASFKSSIERSNLVLKKERAPPFGFYDYDQDILQAKKKNQDLDLKKQPGRNVKLNLD